MTAADEGQQLVPSATSSTMLHEQAAERVGTVATIVCALGLVSTQLSESSDATVHVDRQGTRVASVLVDVAAHPDLGRLLASVQEQAAADGLDVGPVELTCDHLADPLTREVARVVLDPASGEVTVRLASDGTVDLSALFHERLTVAAGALLTDQDQPCTGPSLLGDAERDLIEHQLEPGPVEPTATTVEAMVRASLTAEPGAEFVFHAGRSLSRADADRRIEAMAGLLADRGAGRGQTVAICAAPGIELVLAVFAIMRTGAAYLPINALDPVARRQFIVDDARPMLVVTDLSDFSGDVDVLPLAVLGSATTSAATLPEVAPEDPIYVMYTSGTTGRPKGVTLTHGGVANLVRGLAAHADTPTRGRVLFHTRLSFDASVSELLLPAATGLSIVVADEGSDVETLVRLVEDHEIALVSMVPTMINTFLDLVEERRTLASVQTFLSVGEALPPKIARRFCRAAAAQGSQATLENMYGPTETSVFATGRRIGPDAARITLGRPLTNVRVSVRRTGSDERVGVGVPGEICVSGVGVGLGYLNRPELTAERFVPDPGGTGLMYRTGDIGRWLPTGELDYLGRRDDQIAIRGHRIELGEIEDVLSSVPGVREGRCCVRTVDGRTSLHAFVIADEDVLLAVRPWAEDRLPVYMVPSTIARIDAMPLNVNGKVDRNRLAVLVDEAPQGERPPLTTPEELLLGQVIAGVLKVAPRSSQDTFLALGGDSLTAVMVVATLRRRGQDLALARLLGGDTLGDCAAAMRPAAQLGDARAWQGDGWEDLAWRPDGATLARALGGPAGDDVDALVPLTPMQQGMLVTAQLDPDRTTFIVQQRYETTSSAWDENALREALQQLATRHPGLRTRIVPGAAGDVAVVASHVDLPLTVSQCHSEADVEAFLHRDRRTPFDLAAGPLVRFAWLPCGEAASLVMTYHHVILDGWSQDVLVADLVRLHAASRDGGSVVAVDVERSVRRYGDGVRAQFEPVHEDHWAGLLAGRDDVAETDPWPSVHPDGTAIGSVTHVVDRDVARGVQTMASGHGVTPSAVVEAAWAVVLGQLVGGSDVCYGKVVTQRRFPIPGIADLAGLFINTVPARVRPHPGATVGDVLEEVHAQSLAGVLHSGGTVVDMVRAGGVQSAPQTLYLYESRNEPRDVALAAGLRLVGPSTEQTGVALTLLASESGAGLQLTALYDGLRFGVDDMSRALQRVEHCLAAMVRKPDAAVADLPTLLPDERGSVTGPQHDGLCARVDEEFLRVAGLHGTRTALVHDGDRLTYDELTREAQTVARALVGAGLRPGGAVALLARPETATLVAILGIVLAGGAYVPLDPRLPDERLRLLLDSAAVTHFLAGDAAQARRAGQVCHDAPGIRVVDSAEAADPTPLPAPAARSGEDPIYVMHTSGTTGEPKAVVVPHRAVTRLVVEAQYVSLGTDTVLLQTAALSFDAATFELWGTWLNGGCLVSSSADLHLDPQELGAAIERHAVTHMWLTSSLFNLLVDQAPDIFTPVRELLVGGERLSPEHIRRFHQHNASTTVINGYGPTETTTFATTHRIERGFDTIPIGSPLTNTTVHVVRDGREIGVALPGELWVTGDGVALSYANESAAGGRFVPNPFGSGLAYRTGDVVRRNADDTLDYLGRRDDQVKIRGYRVEPGEVAHALMQMPDVAQATVISRTTTTGAKELVAFVLADPDHDAVERPHRDRLAERLPAWAVPAEVRVVSSWPLTQSGKVDVRALQAGTAESTDPVVHPDPVAADDDDVTAAVCRLYAEVCGIADVTPRTDFFEAGGDSLKAMQLTHLLRRAGYEVHVSAVLREPTPGGLAGLLGAGSPAGASQPPGEPGERTAMQPAEVAVYGAHQTEPTSLAYNVPFGLACDGPVDRGLLRDFFADFLERHVRLRSAYRVDDDVFVAIPGPWATVEIEELPSLDGDVEEALRAFARPFDVAGPPLVRVGVAPGPVGDTVLVDAHHIAFDGTSLEILLRELDGFRSGGPVSPGTPVDPVPATEGALAADLDHWVRQFSEPLEPLDLALGLDGHEDELGVTTLLLPDDVRSALDQLVRDRRTTPFVVYAAAAAIVLQKYTMQDDLVVAVPVDNRPRLGRDGEVGMWVNTVPLRLRPRDEADCGAFLEEAREVAADAVDHSLLPYADVVSGLAARGVPAARRLAQAMVAFRTAERDLVAVGERTARLVGPLSLAPKFDVEFTVTRTPEHDLLGVEYRTTALDAMTADLVLHHFVDVVHALTRPDGLRIADIVLT